VAQEEPVRTDPIITPTNGMSGIAPTNVATGTAAASTVLGVAIAGSRPDEDVPPPDLKIFGMTIRRPRLGKDFISDGQFIRDLQQLKDLRSFLIRDAVKLDALEPNSLSFGGLNLLRYHAFGRTPTEAEWSKLEKLTQTLFALPNEAITRKFARSRIPWWMAWIPVILAVVALVSLALSQLLGTISINGKAEIVPSYILISYALWLMSLGAIGAVAFVGMNALSVQEDITFDLANDRLMILRIVLGALFGLVLTLPFGYDEFVEFCKKISAGVAVAATKDDKSTQQAIMLLLPFVLGFSTPLVILVLNRFVESIQSFFGKSGNQTAPPTSGSKPA
jgi:hypothetical protein